MAAPKGPGKQFEAEARVALDALYAQGYIAKPVKIPEPLIRIGNRTFFANERMPADFLSRLRDGGQQILVECKRTDGASLKVLADGQQGDGIKEHQLLSLIEAASDGAIALLIVGMPRHGVWCIDGLDLLQWNMGEDPKGNLKSISLAFMQDYAYPLGILGDWAIPPEVLRARTPFTIPRKELLYHGKEQTPKRISPPHAVGPRDKDGHAIPEAPE